MSQLVQAVKIAVTTTGSAGSATGETTSAVLQNVAGALWSIYFDFHASAPSSTDLVVTEVGGAGRTLLTLTNVNTDASYPVRIAETGVTGTALGTYTPFVLPVGSQIKVAVSGSNALTDCVVAWCYILQ